MLEYSFLHFFYVRILGPILVQAFLILISAYKIFSTVSLSMCVVQDIIRTFIRRYAKTIFFQTFSSVLEVDDRPDCTSSIQFKILVQTDETPKIQ